MTIIKKLDAMPYAQAHIEIKDENVYLFSYSTLVAGLIGDWAFCNGYYSNTTSHHVSAFAREFGTDYHTFKLCAKDDVVINIKTGEVQDRN